MYAATKKQTSSTRVVGLVMVVVINGVVGLALATGMGGPIITALTQTEVVIIDTPVVQEEEPPPPPPPDLDLPPPPPQVVLPEFVFDMPPPPTAITQVEQVQQPRPAAVAPPPPPAPPAGPVLATRPVAGRGFTLGEQDYPPVSLRAREEGVTTVSMCVNERGQISDVRLIRSSGFDRLDQQTIRLLPRQRLEPARDTQGRPMQICDHQLDIEWKITQRR